MSLTPDIMSDPGPGAAPTDPSANLNSYGSGARQDFSADNATGSGSSAGSSGSGAGTGADAPDPWEVAWNPSWGGGSGSSTAQQLNSMEAGLGNNTGDWTKSPDGDVYDGIDSSIPGSQAGTTLGTNGENSQNLAGFNDSMIKGSGDTQAEVTAYDNFLGYSQGGTVTDDNNQGGGDPQQQAIQQAMNTVDGVLAFGYKLNGLGGDSSDSDGAIPGAQASAMPTIPGNQSNSGLPVQPPGPRPPQQLSANMPTAPASQSNSGLPQAPPGPGTLPPTSNPFGQRTSTPLQMSNSGGAIDTSDEQDQSS